MIGRNGQADSPPASYCGIMKKIIIWIMLVALTLTGALVEGLVESLPQTLVQISGALTILLAIALIAWTLSSAGRDQGQH